jgi:hypothetical protein
VNGETCVRSYHDVEVGFDGKRGKLFDLSYGLELTCTRAGGWQLWNKWEGRSTLVAGEYDSPELMVWVAGVLVCGSEGGAA